LAVILRNVLIAVGTTLAFLCIHEAGHAMAAWRSGGTILQVVLFSLRPHVSIAGPATHAQEAFRAAGGSLTSLLACFGLLLLAPLRGSGWQLLRSTAAMFGCVELVGWSVSSLIHARSVSPDDAERFVTASGAGAFPIVAICVMLGFAGLLLMRRGELRWRERQAATARALTKSATNGC
jgi:hypothetical protein